MAYSLSVASAIEKSRIASTTPFLIALDITVYDPLVGTGVAVETLRVVNNSEAITWRGNVYAPAQFDVRLKQEAGTQSQLQLSMRDLTRAIQARMQAYGGGVGFKVVLTAINAGNLTQPPEIQETFEVISATAEEYNVTFTLGAENSLSKNFPRRIQTRDYCQWRYKGAQCKYTGALPTCDLSFNGPNGCGAHQNTINFGGFPGISNNGRSYT